MKRNLLLFLMVLVMGGLAYYSQEYQVKIKEEASFLPEVNLGSLKSIATKNIKIEMNDRGFWIPRLNAPADPIMCHYVLKLLDTLRVEEELQTSEVTKVGSKSFFPEDDFLEFQDKSSRVVQMKIGNKLSYGRSFYAGIKANGKWKYYILKDHSPLVGMYSEEQYQVSNEQYLKYVGLLHLDEKFFLPQSHAFYLKGATQLQVRSNIAKPFVINFEQRQIAPKVFASVEIDPAKIQNYLNEMAKLKVENVYSISPQKKQMIFEQAEGFEKLKGELVFEYSDAEKVILKFFEEGDKLLVYNNMWPFAQSYLKEHFAQIFPHHQEFYKKMPFKKLATESVRPVNLFDLTDHFISYLREQADWLTKVDKIDAQLLKNKVMQFQSEGKQFSLFQLNTDLVLVDVKENIKYHYYRGLIELEKVKRHLDEESSEENK